MSWNWYDPRILNTTCLLTMIIEKRCVFCAYENHLWIALFLKKTLSLLRSKLALNFSEKTLTIHVLSANHVTFFCGRKIKKKVPLFMSNPLFQIGYHNWGQLPATARFAKLQKHCLEQTAKRSWNILDGQNKIKTLT